MSPLKNWLLNVWQRVSEDENHILTLILSVIIIELCAPVDPEFQCIPRAITSRKSLSHQLRFRSFPESQRMSLLLNLRLRLLASKTLERSKISNGCIVWSDVSFVVLSVTDSTLISVLKSLSLIEQILNQSMMTLVWMKILAGEIHINCCCFYVTWIS